MIVTLSILLTQITLEHIATLFFVSSIVLMAAVTVAVGFRV